ncbi:thioredoxin domain-containing protein [Micropruina sp.]|uniref:thioredoxin family protein n=1 Tax=Micropruina sp. TaxID=2737536 RepID=UPI002611572D|nr:thioredoxin domain-containing protein [Micropruina sp.]
MAHVTAVTDDTFESKVVRASKPVLVDYWADWCAPCRQIAPIIEELAREHGDRIDFYSLDTNTNPRIPTEQGVLGLPTIQIYSGGELVKSFTGGKTKAALLRALDEFI